MTDCVGPLPKSKGSNLLTTLDVAIHYPEAFELRGIKAKPLSFSWACLPHIIQSYRNFNFTSKL